MVPIGSIVLWFGSIESIPDGWHFCNGSGGTPDLKNRFVKGASVAQPPGTRGGANTHDHAFTGDGHSHDFLSSALNVPGGTEDIWFAGNDDFESQENPAQGTTESSDNQPLYHQLIYMMRIS